VHFEIIIAVHRDPAEGVTKKPIGAFTNRLREAFVACADVEEPSVPLSDVVENGTATAAAGVLIHRAHIALFNY